MPLTVKICGLTDLADARFCAGAGADYLGFIQYPKSPRYVVPEAAAEIIGWVYGPECVGVFVNETAETVNRLAEQAGFDRVQLHGNESPELCADVERPVIKAHRIAPHTDSDELRRTMDRYAAVVDCFLFDTWDAAQWGGTGRSFDWSVVRPLAADYPVLLSGGLGAHNVAEAARQAVPLGVDSSSRLESEPGRKDLDKVAAFFRVLRSVDH